MEFYDSFELLRGSQYQFQEDERVKVFALMDQGPRASMEDGCAIATGLPCSASLIGVFDGHGGQDAARFCTRNMFRHLLKERGFNNGQLKNALQDAFLRIDEDFGVESREAGSSGATAAVVVVKDGRFVVAHAGDCYCSLFKKGWMVHLTQDHSPHNRKEADRIRRGGKSCRIQDGTLDKSGITLAVTRAIGDFEFKDDRGKSPEEQVVIAVPEISEQEIGDDCEYLVVASDGLPKEQVESHGMEMSKALVSKNKKDLRSCLQKIISQGLKDNRTIVVIELKKKKEDKRNADEAGLELENRNCQEKRSRNRNKRKKHIPCLNKKP